VAKEGKEGRNQAGERNRVLNLVLCCSLSVCLECLLCFWLARLRCAEMCCWLGGVVEGCGEGDG